MATLRLTVRIEADAEDVSDETMKAVEIQCARWSELMEAKLAENICKACPKLTVVTGSEEDECNL